MPDSGSALSGAVLAFDYGSVKTGVAVGDTVTGNANPIERLPARRGQPDWPRILATLAEWRPCWLVVGLPLNADGSESDISGKARRFALELSRRSGLPCSLSDERLSSVMARGARRERPDSNASTDSLAAAIILNGWLAEPRPQRAAAIAQRLAAVRSRIADASRAAGRPRRSVRLVAASKTQTPDTLRAAHAEGVVDFAENYAQALGRNSAALADRAVCWHFIGAIQRNKTRIISAHCDWAHSVDSVAVARRLNDQRPAERPALNCCVQIGAGGGAGRGGAEPAELADIARQIHAMPRLALRGLMTLPEPDAGAAGARRVFDQLAGMLAALRAAPELAGAQLDTLSMGMSGDLEQAVAAGATMVRVGSALFGPRDA